MPSIAPPLAAPPYTRASARAVAWPLAAGISAARQPRLAVMFWLSGPAIGGLEKAAAPTLSGPPNASIMSGASGSTGASSKVEIRPSYSGPVPMCASRPSGAANSSRQYVPSERPSIRRTTSPTSQP